MDSKQKLLRKADAGLKRSAVSVGNAGEHLVMAELLMRGHQAALADRNNRAFDILARCRGRYVSLRVKSSSSYRVNWTAKPDGSIFPEFDPRDPSDYVVIVLMPDKEPRRSIVYIVPTDVVHKELDRRHKLWIGTPARSGQPRKVTNMRGLMFEGNETASGAARGYQTLWAQYEEAWHLLLGDT